MNQTHNPSFLDIIIPSDGISILFVVLLVGIFLLFMYYHFKERKLFKHTLDVLSDAMNRYSCTDAKVSSTNAMFQYVSNSKESPLCEIMQLFRNSLMEYLDTKTGVARYCNAKSAEDFFNEHSLASNICEQRSVVPSLLTGVGVLGTFIGLLCALQDLNITEIFNTLNESGKGVADISQKLQENLSPQLQKLLDGAKVAFVTSVWGITFSFVATLAKKWVAGDTRKRIQELQKNLDNIFIPNISNDNVLRKMGVKTDSVQDCIRDMSKDIVTAFEQSSEKSAKLVADQISQYLVEVNEKAVDQAIANLEKALDKVFTRYADTFSQAGSVFAENVRNSNSIVLNTYTKWQENFEQMATACSTNIANSLTQAGTAFEAQVRTGTESVTAAYNKWLQDFNSATVESVNSMKSLHDDILNKIGELHGLETSIAESLAQSVSADFVKMRENLSASMEQDIKNYADNVNALTIQLNKQWSEAYLNHCKSYEETMKNSVKQIENAFTKIIDAQLGRS